MIDRHRKIEIENKEKSKEKCKPARRSFETEVPDPDEAVWPFAASDI